MFFPRIFMVSIDRLSELRQQAQTLKKSSEVVGFVEKYAEDLKSILGTLPETHMTKQQLVTLLDDAYTEYSLDLQRKKQKKLLKSGALVRPKQALEWTKKAHMAKQNYLPCIMQSAFSLPEDYVVSPYESKISHNQYIDAVSIVPSTIPQSFITVFGLDHIDDDAQNVKELFKKAQPLEYYKEKLTKTWRIVTIDGKLVVFRTLEQLLEDNKPYTQGSKRRYDTKKYMNAFDNVYSAIRSQYHTIDSEANKIDKYQDVQKHIIELMQDLKSQMKDFSARRQIDQLIVDIGQATSFPVMAGKVYHLFEFAFGNRGIASKQLEGLDNKLSKEIIKLYDISVEIQLQTNALEKYKYAQEHSIAMFHSQIRKSVSTRDINGLAFAFENYVRALGTSIQTTEPFVSFDRDIRELMSSMKKPQSNHQLFLKAELLVAFQHLLLQAYQLEHAIKTGTVKSSDFVFDNKIFTKYPTLYHDLFKNIDEYLHKLSRTSEKFGDNSQKEQYCTLLQTFRKLPDRQENIAILKQI